VLPLHISLTVQVLVQVTMPPQPFGAGPHSRPLQAVLFGVQVEHAPLGKHVLPI
jgi:hypothetical protein